MGIGSKLSVMVLEPPYGFSPNDVSKYYIKAFNKLDLQVLNFPAHKYVTYHGLSSDYLTKIGAMGTGMSREAILDLTQTSMMGAVMKAKPDLLIIVHGHCFDKYVIEDITDYVWKYGGAVSLITTESPHDKDEEIICASMVDNVFTTDISGNSYLKNAKYIGHSYSEDIHLPRLISQESRYNVDVGFVGSFFKERVLLFDKLVSKGYSTYLAGIVDEYIDEITEDLVKAIRPIVKENEELPFIYSGSKFSINFTRRSKDLYSAVNIDTPTVQQSVTIRMVECMASGGVLLTDKTKELDENFIDGEDYISYSDGEELIEKVSRYIDDEESLFNIRKNAFKKVREVKNSYTDNAKTIINTVFGDGTV